MNDNRRIAFNSAVIFVRLIVVSIISLASARFVLQALGASDYGLYNVVGGIVALLNVINTAMVTTTYRYIAYELGKGTDSNPNKVFNTSLTIHAIFALLIFALGLPFGELYIDNCLNVASDSIPDAHFVLRISILTTMITTTLIPYQGLMTAYEKFYVPAIFDIICQLFRLGAVVALTYYGSNKIRLYSIIMLSYNIVYAFLYFLYSHRYHLSVVKIKVQNDWKLYKEMFAFSGWILFGACASIGKTQGSTMLVNFFFGTIVNAAFAVANQVENFILMFSRMLNQAAVPQITKNYSGGNQNRSVNLASYISKYTFILMSLVAYPVIMEMDFILKIWLKTPPEGSTIFCQLMILGGLIGCMGEGIPALTQASGKIRIFQLVLSTISLMGLPIAFVCYKLGAAAYSILVVFVIISLLCATIRLLLLKTILHINIKSFIITSYWRMLLISVFPATLYYFYDPTGFSTVQHIIGLLGLEGFLIINIIILGIDKREWDIIKCHIPHKLKIWQK